MSATEKSVARGDAVGRSERRVWIAVGAGFVLTRIFLVWLAHSPESQGAAFGDLVKYEEWARSLVGRSGTPYADVDVEYPPGILPVIAIPELVRLGDLPYGFRFIWLMLVLDVLVFAALVRLGRRNESPWGALVWVLGVPAVGPIAYLRLDLIPAAATVAALTQAARARWEETGVWLALGAAAKIYPAFLLPPAVWVARRRLRMLAAAAVCTVVVLAPFAVAGTLGDLLDKVLGYHGARGIHVESTWGSLVFVATVFGYDTSINFLFGANEIVAPVAPVLAKISTVVSVAALAAAVAVIARTVPRGAVSRLAPAQFAVLALLMFVGKVFSPQYMVWLVALAAAGLCYPLPFRLALPLGLVIPAAILTQVVYPFTIGEVLAPFYEGQLAPGFPPGLIALVARNFFVGALGVAALVALKPRREDDDGSDRVVGGDG